jgi:hypothetical protein
MKFLRSTLPSLGTTCNYREALLLHNYAILNINPKALPNHTVYIHHLCQVRVMYITTY